MNLIEDRLNQLRKEYLTANPYRKAQLEVEANYLKRMKEWPERKTNFVEKPWPRKNLEQLVQEELL